MILVLTRVLIINLVIASFSIAVTVITSLHLKNKVKEGEMFFTYCVIKAANLTR